MYKFKYPSLVSIFVTNNCNLKCNHCCFEAGGSVHKDLTTEQMMYIIKKFTKTGIVCLDFSGGEPFLRKDFLKLVEFAFESGIQSLSIATNTLAITEQQADDLKKLQDKYRLIYLRLSLDGATKDTHEWLRGKDTFEKTLDKIAFLKDKGLNLRELNTVVSQKNYHEIPQIISIAKKFGIKTSVLLPLIPVGRAKHIQDYMITPEQWKQLCIAKKDMEKEIGIEIFADSPVSTTLNEKNIGKTLPCMCGQQFLGVLPDGRYTVCPIVSEGESSVFEQEIDDFWANSKLICNIRDISKLTGKCSCCEYKELCRGGCRGLAHYYYGSFFKPDPLCWVTPKALQKLD